MCRAGAPPGQVWEALVVHLVLLHPLLKFESLCFHYNCNQYIFQHLLFCFPWKKESRM